METQPLFNDVQAEKPVLSSIGNLLERTVHTYFERFGVFMGVVMPYFLSSLLYILFVKQNSSLASQLSLVAAAVLAICISWSSVSLFYVVKERSQKIGVGGSLDKGSKKIISYLWLGFLTGFIVLGGFLLFVIPGIILGILFSLATTVLIAEELGGVNALARSRQLVKGNALNIFFKFLIFGIIVGILDAFIGGLVKALAPSIYEYVNIVWASLLMPFSTIFAFLVYEDVKRVKGDVPFEAPQKGEKSTYILLGILGLVAIPVAIFLLIVPSYNSAKSKATEARVAADMMQLRVVMETYSMSTGGYAGADCGKENISSVCDGIMKDVGNNPVIRTSPSEYCAYVKINKTEYYCINSNFDKERGTVPPDGAGYCDGITFNCPKSNTSSAIY